MRAAIKKGAGRRVSFADAAISLVSARSIGKGTGSE